ncbi:esterase [Streptomyces olivochromogenes]|uniref:Esterase n=1 Tax=Streptomyces olivochromogenes TaxID=1963 RepID=A0A250V4Z3_STROL|nr:esterase [Streptomyces olivochromogenes]
MLRDEGEVYARKLTQVGVPTTSIRVNGTPHDFMMLTPIRPAQSPTAAVEQVIHALRTALRGDWEFRRFEGVARGEPRDEQFGKAGKNLAGSGLTAKTSTVDSASRLNAATPTRNRSGASPLCGPNAVQWASR